MILSGKEIQAQLGKTVFIEPFDPKQLNPNSYNLRLHEDFLVYDEAILDMKSKNKTSKIKIPKEGLVLEPGKLYLGRTVETTRADNYVPKLDGRSSVGRLGVFIHITAGLGHIGANGFWTLEIACIQPVRIYPDLEICQIYFHNIQGVHEKYNSKKYHNNNGVQPSLMYMDFDEDK